MLYGLVIGLNYGILLDLNNQENLKELQTVLPVNGVFQ